MAEMRAQGWKLLLAAMAACAGWGQEGQTRVVARCVDDGSGAGVKGAVVQVRVGNEAGNARTDEEGRAVVEAARAGGAEFSCAAAGYVTHYAWVKVGGGAVKVEARLKRAAVVTGTVRLGRERAGAGVTVVIERRGGRPRYTAKTDANGAYRFDRLAQGSYLVSAGRMGEGAEFAPAYYPNVERREEAVVLRVAAGAEMQGIDVELRKAQVQRVRGVVMDEAGVAVGGVAVSLYGEDAWFGAEGTRLAGGDGRFEFEKVRRGEWRVRARATRAGVELKGAMRMEVSKEDVDNVVVRVHAPFEVQGVVERDEARDGEGLRKVSGVVLEEVEAGERIGPVFHEQDGRITFRAVYPGRYRILPVGFLAGWYVESVKVGEVEAMVEAVELNAASAPVRIVYKPQAARVRGVVERGEGATVLLLPAEEALWDGQFIRTARAGAGGQYEVGSLRPGEYYAFALREAPEMDEWEDKVLVRRMLGEGKRVRVKQGEVAEAGLKVLESGLW